MNVSIDLRGYSRNWLLEFVEKYKNEECLWKSQHPDYSNHSVRNESYDKLVDKLKEVEPNPDRTMVVKKINSLRSAFRREYRKKMMNPDYETRLWYFDKLYFISDQNPKKSQKRRQLSIKIDEDSIEHILPDEQLMEKCEDMEQEVHLDQTDLSDNNQELDSSGHQSYKAESSQTQTSYKIVEITPLDSSNRDVQQAVSSIEGQQQVQMQHTTQNQQSQQNQSQIPAQLTQIPTIQISREHLPLFNSTYTDRHQDEYDAVGVNVASKLRSMNHTQRIIAEKLIGDILFNGQLNSLTVSSRVSQ